MKFNLRAIVALIMALILFAAVMPTAMAEDAEIVSDRVDAPVAALEASELPNGFSVMPTYPSQSLTYELTDVRRVNANVSDQVGLHLSEGRIKSFYISNPEVVEAHLDYAFAISLYLAAPGKTEITVKLEDGRQYKVKLKVKDPWKPTDIVMDGDSFNLLVGQDMNAMEHVRIFPEWAEAKYRFKSSSGKVAVDKNGLVTAQKPGKAVITVTAGKHLKTRFTVIVTANRAEDLAPAPTKSDVKALSGGWTLWPRALEMTADGGAVLEAYVLNGTGAKLTVLEDLDLALEIGSKSRGATLARHRFEKVKMSCGKGASKRVKLTFPPASVQQPFTDLSTGAVSVKLYSNPRARAGGVAFDFASSAYIAPQADPEAENPVVYRALLVSEDDFYWGTEPGDETKWEHDGRNRGDVRLLAEMLGSVKTPNESRYSVTTRNNTNVEQLVDLIADTFASADKNDVSLFFIATHGVDDSAAPADFAGALAMASLTDQYPETLKIGTLRDCLKKVPGKVIVLIQSCGGGAAIYRKNGASDPDAMERACAAFDAAVVDAFQCADPGIEASSEVDPNTGELRRMNKFYVLTASAFEETSFGMEFTAFDGFNYFTKWLAHGVGHSGSMPADRRYAGNSDGVVDLHELYRYISAVGDDYRMYIEGGVCCCQHVQVYPADTRYPLFR